MSVGPFTEAYTKGQAEYLKAHPEAAHEPVAPLVQLMLDQEAATAKDFAEGKISQAEYDGFLAKSESGLSDFRDHLQEAGQEFVQNFGDWAHDAKAEYETLKQDHPEVIQALETGHVTAVEGAVTMEFAVNVLEPLVDTALDGVVVIIDHVDTGLSEAATGLVEARNALPCVDAEERSANLSLLDAAQSDWHQTLDTGKDAIAGLHDKISDDFGQMHDVVDAFQDYAADHPDVVLMDQTIDAPDVQQQIQHESDLAEV